MLKHFLTAFLLGITSTLALADGGFSNFPELHWKAPVASVAALPTNGNVPGDARVELTGFGEYIWNGSAWNQVGGGGGGNIASINGDTTAAQLLSVGSAGTDFAIVDAGGGSHVFNLPIASALNTGKLSSADWSTFNGKQNALTFGNLTDVGTDGLTVTGGTGAVIGSGTSLSQHVADTTHNGYLSSTDWNTFNGKLSSAVTSINSDTTAAQTLSAGTSGTDFAIVDGGGGAHTFNLPVASAVNTGKLSSTDWSTFNGKQPAGNYITALTGDVTATGPGSVDSILAASPHWVFVDYQAGDDTTGTGTLVRPWKSIAHTCATITPTINFPVTIKISGGNNDPDTLAITCPPNITFTADYPIQIAKAITITGGTTNDQVNANNIIFVGALTWIRNDNSAIGMNLVNVEFFSGPVLKQTGTGTATMNAQTSVFVNADLGVARTGSFFENDQFFGTTTFEDTTNAAYYQIMGGYYSGAINVSGGAQLYLSGVQADTPFGAALNGTTTANGTPVFQYDSGSVPPTIGGAFTSILISNANHEKYTVGTSANWNSVPTDVATALDDLASTQIFKSQAQNLFFASPNGSSGLMSPRAIVGADLPAINLAASGAGGVTGVLPVANGGTNISSYTTGDVLYASSSSVLSKLPIGTTNQCLIVTGGLPAWGSCTSGGGVTTMGVFGSSPNANGGTISGNTLTLQPADATNPGGVSTTTQTLAGDKTLSGNTTIGANITFSMASSGVSGTNANLAAHSTAFTRLTNAALVSLASMDITGVTSGHRVLLFNDTGNPVTIVDNYVSAPANSQIITGYGANVVLDNGSALEFMYDATGVAAWHMVAGLGYATGSNPGILSSTDWSTFNNKQNALTFGNLTDAGTDGITVTGGTGAVIGSGTSLSQHVADTTHNGYLSSTDWNTFNNKQATISIGSFSASPSAAGLTLSGAAINMDPADGTHPGGVSTTTQTLAGAKTFSTSITDSGPLNMNGTMVTGVTTDSTTTGANAELASIPTPDIRLTNASLTSLAYILNTSVSDGTFIEIQNLTGATISIIDNGGSAPAGSKAIMTGYGNTLLLENGASILVSYDNANTAWRVIGGNFDPSMANAAGTLAVNHGGTGASTLTANNVILGNGTSPVNFVAPGTSGNVLTSNGTTWTSAAATGPTPVVLRVGWDTTSQSTGTNTTLKFQNVDVDTASGYNATTGEYTFPNTANYHACVRMELDSTSFTGPQAIYLKFQLNGSDISYVEERVFPTVSSVSGLAGYGCDIIHATAGDKLTAVGLSDWGGTIFHTTSATADKRTYMNIDQIH